MRATPGRVLPVRVATMAYEADHILRSEVAEDTHCLVRHAWLPSGRRVQLSQVHGATIRWARLAEHVLLKLHLIPDRGTEETCTAIPASSIS